MCLCDERLGFGADKLLLEGDKLGGFGLLVLELLDLILDLCRVSLVLGTRILFGAMRD